MNSPSLWIAVSASLGAVGVALGALGAHALKARLTPDQLASWGTAVDYHLLHSIALLALALFSAATGRSVQLPAVLFTAGILLFSGSIYLLLLTHQRWLGPLTPLGGLCLIAAWISLLGLLRSPSA
ncbi:MAG: DUF423 domain-containing protein [Deltaproteobacteria bacterium]|nr:DUF423 domain-containing protein [Deltaproteobacteria bacterium]